MIKTENICKEFKTNNGKIKALDNINMDIKQGEIFGLLGPNGAGKTTLIRILSGILLPTEGEAYVNNYDVIRKDKILKNTIGIVTSDERSFFGRLTGGENLKFFGALYNINGGYLKSRISSVMQLLNIEHEKDKLFQYYSTGNKKKLSIARSLLHNPSVLFMDEATNSLDPVGIDELKQLVKLELSQKQNKTVFWATHRLEEAEEICDRIALLNKGKILFIGTIDEFKRRRKDNNLSLAEIFKQIIAES